MYVRPIAPDTDYASAWSSNLANEVNCNRVDKTFAEGPELDDVSFRYAGNYTFSSSYEPGDVVFVDPNASYWDQTGAVLPVCTGSSSTGLPPLCAGLFVCTNFVPAYGYDITYLTGSIASVYSSSGQTITGQFADTFRLYGYNCYYPIYPVIPTAYQTTASVAGVTIQADLNFWAPLAPMMLMQMCGAGGVTTKVYVGGVASGSVFNPAQKPY